MHRMLLSKPGLNAFHIPRSAAMSLMIAIILLFSHPLFSEEMKFSYLVDFRDDPKLEIYFYDSQYFQTQLGEDYIYSINQGNLGVGIFLEVVANTGFNITITGSPFIDAENTNRSISDYTIKMSRLTHYSSGGVNDWSSYNDEGKQIIRFEQYLDTQAGEQKVHYRLEYEFLPATWTDFAASDSYKSTLKVEVTANT